MEQTALIVHKLQTPNLESIALDALKSTIYLSDVLITSYSLAPQNKGVKLCEATDTCCQSAHIAR